MGGEVDIGVLPISGAVAQADRLHVLGVFHRESIVVAKTNDAPTINSVFGTTIPDLYVSRSWAIHARAIERYPDRFRLLEETALKAHVHDAVRDACVKTGAPIDRRERRPSARGHVGPARGTVCTTR